MHRPNFAFIDTEFPREGDDEYEPLFVVAIQPKDWEEYDAKGDRGKPETMEVAPGSTPDDVDQCIKECRDIMIVYHDDGQWYFTDEEMATSMENMKAFIRAIHDQPRYRVLWDELQAVARDELPKIIEEEYYWVEQSAGPSEAGEIDVNWPTYRQLFIKRSVMDELRSAIGQ